MHRCGSSSPCTTIWRPATRIAATTSRLQRAVDAILDGYSRGTRFGIAADDDGLLRAGVPGVQLTWMDAKVGDWVVTPRIGKPVEVQALWINALRIARDVESALAANCATARARRSFAERFVDPSTRRALRCRRRRSRAGQGRSLDSSEPDLRGRRPAVSRLLEGAAARAVVAQVEAQLLTPLGLRTLAPSDPAYRGALCGRRCSSAIGAYHQGTVWPWLIGPFVEAWLRVHGAGGRARALSRAALRASGPRGLDHICEVADGDAPHTPGGTPFQAWSLGELLRIEKLLGRQ